MLGLKLNHVSKRGHWLTYINQTHWFLRTDCRVSQNRVYISCSGIRMRIRYSNSFGCRHNYGKWITTFFRILLYGYGVFSLALSWERSIRSAHMNCLCIWLYCNSCMDDCDALSKQSMPVYIAVGSWPISGLTWTGRLWWYMPIDMYAQSMQAVTHSRYTIEYMRKQWNHTEI